jgi:hypothetical protein
VKRGSFSDLNFLDALPDDGIAVLEVDGKQENVGQHLHLGANAMINVFRDFCQFSATKLKKKLFLSQ